MATSTNNINNINEVKRTHILDDFNYPEHQTTCNNNRLTFVDRPRISVRRSDVFGTLMLLLVTICTCVNNSSFVKSSCISALQLVERVLAKDGL